MASDVWNAFLQGMARFAQTRGARLVATSFRDTGPFLLSLRDGSGDDNTRTALDKLKADVDALSAEGKLIDKAIKDEIAIAKQAVIDCDAEIKKDPFELANATATAYFLGEIFSAFDRALLKSAKAAAHGNADIEKAIAGITAPWKRPFQELGSSFTGDFDTAALKLFRIPGASARLASTLGFDRSKLRIEMKLVQVGQIIPDGVPTAGGKPIFSFDGVDLVAFLSFKNKSVLGITLRSKLKAGLRGDGLVSKVIPDGAPSTDASYSAITLDTDKGLTFGDEGSKSIILPVRFDYPGVELREVALVLPETGGKSGEIQLRTTIAGKLGEVLGVVVEGSGIALEGDTWTFKPRPPDALGVRVKVPVVTGGGYLRQSEDFKQLKGALDLRIGPIGITAFALISTEPFSLVVVMSVQFHPKIELGLGFTLTGVGGLLALDRRTNFDEFRKGIHDGTASLLLFPDDPIMSAPKILTKLEKVFPAAGANEHTFVVGPLLKLGWGSQAGFVLAKLGVLVVLPDPKVVLLGSLDIGIPSAEVKPELRIIDLHAELYGEIDPEYLLLRVSLSRSRVGGVPITGDIGLFIRWVAEPTFAICVGGFHPRYSQKPKELADLQRITIDLSPGKYDWLHITAKGYVALTASSLQFGAGIWLSAEIGPAAGEAWISLDAIFVWSPRFYFEAVLDAGLSVKVFGETIVGVRFTGTLKGTTPWHIHATAMVDLPIVPDLPFEVGPIEWGEKDASVPQVLNPRLLVVDALKRPTAWAAELPRGADMMVRFAEGRDDVVLVHPLGILSVRQELVPLDRKIDRIGQNPVQPNTVSLAPSDGEKAFVSLMQAPLPPGHFFDLPKDQQITLPDFDDYPVGIRFSSENQPLHGTGLGASYSWETCYPQENFGRGKDQLKFLGALAAFALDRNAVAAAARERVNPYVNPHREPLVVPSQPSYELRSRDDLTVIADGPSVGATDAWKVKTNDEALPIRGIEMVVQGVAA
ncbi:DUF6603 domain-containing protein [Ensifer aridi]|uniref:DUF6603 domain-containing protein n=1 Tax=Ensifer aridi TaxID=1708715 RepID=UPI000A105C1E|nr:DUF6603 domain-containing protein [Ensifer aridi]